MVARLQELFQVEPGVPLAPCQGHDHGLYGGLGCPQGQGGQARVDHVHAGLDGLQAGHGGHAAGVVGVKLHGHVQGVLQRSDEGVGVVGREDPGHVLDADAVGVQVPEYSCPIQEVVEVVYGAAEAALAGDGVADGHLEMLARALDGGGGPGEVALVVQGVEDAEDVDARLGGVLDEGVDEVVGVVAVTDEGLAAQQHLQGRVGHEGLEGAEALPGVLGQEPGRRVEGRAAPDLHGVEAYGVHRLRDGGHVLHAEPSRHQALMGVPEGGVGYLDLCHGNSIIPNRLPAEDSGQPYLHFSFQTCVTGARHVDRDYEPPVEGP